ncbi:MAG: PhnD/SsuA/transferrin family substrate-binding protein [Paracoccaceae bacterium]|jgi:ABC-type phosphate/phosphonate transport system substrate-binding protein|nr:PhnD/SsuA/transferrin family substrate-binding protein [Paracoccaceae bacterium]
MIASLQMYKRPELTDAHAHFWSLISHNLIELGITAPMELNQGKEVMEVWMDPDLVLSQTCGMPYRKFLHEKVNMVGTPIYDLEGCPPGYYQSCIVVRKNETGSDLSELCHKRFAFNEETSQSGYAAPLTHAARKGLQLLNRAKSGSHRCSAKMIVDGKADFGALDALSWKLIQQYDAFASELRVLEVTEPVTPGLPYITSLKYDSELVFTAIETAIHNLSQSDRDALCIKGILKIPVSDYLKVPDF